MLPASCVPLLSPTVLGRELGGTQVPLLSPPDFPPHAASPAQDLGRDTEGLSAEIAGASPPTYSPSSLPQLRDLGNLSLALPVDVGGARLPQSILYFHPSGRNGSVSGPCSWSPGEVCRRAMALTLRSGRAAQPPRGPARPGHGPVSATAVPAGLPWSSAHGLSTGGTPLLAAFCPLFPLLCFLRF